MYLSACMVSAYSSEHEMFHVHGVESVDDGVSMLPSLQYIWILATIRRRSEG